MTTLFALGAIVVTPDAAEALRNARTPVRQLLAYHLAGDYGAIRARGRIENAQALSQSGRLISSHSLGPHGRVLLITSGGRPCDRDACQRV